MNALQRVLARSQNPDSSPLDRILARSEQPEAFVPPPPGPERPPSMGGVPMPGSWGAELSDAVVERGIKGNLRSIAGGFVESAGQEYSRPLMDRAVDAVAASPLQGLNTLARLYRTAVPPEPPQNVPGTVSGAIQDYGSEVRESGERSIRATPATVPTLDKIDTANDLALWAINAFGSNVPMLGVTMGASAVHPMLGMSAAQAMMTGEVQNTFKEYGIKDPSLAQTLALPLAALEYVGGLGVSGKIKNEAVKKVIERVSRSLPGRAARGFLVEGGTEAVQDATMDVVAGTKVGQPLLEIIKRSGPEWVESFAQGGVAGAPVAAVMGDPGTQIEEAPPPPAPETEDTEVTRSMESAYEVRAQHANDALESVLARTEDVPRGTSAPDPDRYARDVAAVRQYQAEAAKGGVESTPKLVEPTETEVLLARDAVRIGANVVVVEDGPAGLPAFTSENGTIVVQRGYTDEGYRRLASHETIHALRMSDPEVYEWLRGQFQAHSSELRKSAQRGYIKSLRRVAPDIADRVESDASTLEEEGIAFSIEHLSHLMADQEAVETMARENPGMWQRFKDWFDQFVDKLFTTGRGKQIRRETEIGRALLNYQRAINQAEAKRFGEVQAEVSAQEDAEVAAAQAAEEAVPVEEQEQDLDEDRPVGQSLADVIIEAGGIRIQEDSGEYKRLVGKESGTGNDLFLSGVLNKTEGKMRADEMAMYLTEHHPEMLSVIPHEGSTISGTDVLAALEDRELANRRPDPDAEMSEQWQDDRALLEVQLDYLKGRLESATDQDEINLLENKIEDVEAALGPAEPVVEGENLPFATETTEAGEQELIDDPATKRKVPATAKKGGGTLEGTPLGEMTPERQGDKKASDQLGLFATESNDSLLDQYWRLTKAIHTGTPEEATKLRKAVKALDRLMRERGITPEDVYNHGLKLKGRGNFAVSTGEEFAVHDNGEQEQTYPQLELDLGERARETADQKGDFDRHLHKLQVENNNRRRKIESFLGENGGAVVYDKGERAALVTKNPMPNREEFPWRVTHYGKYDLENEDAFLPSGHNDARDVADAVKIVMEYTPGRKDFAAGSFAAESPVNVDASRTEINKVLNESGLVRGIFTENGRMISGDGMHWTHADLEVASRDQLGDDMLAGDVRLFRTEDGETFAEVPFDEDGVLPDPDAVAAVMRVARPARILDIADGHGDMKPAFASAYHASPHEVDEFSTDYVGTGEGNQTYGWGLYFAQARGVADWYKNSFGRKQGRRIQLFDGTKWGDKDIAYRGEFEEDESRIAHWTAERILDRYENEQKTRSGKSLQQVAQEFVNEKEIELADEIEELEALNNDDAEWLFTFDNLKGAIKTMWDTPVSDEVVNLIYSDATYGIDRVGEYHDDALLRGLSDDALISDVDIIRTIERRFTPMSRDRQIDLAEGRVARKQESVRVSRKIASDKKARMVSGAQGYRVELAPGEDEYLLWDLPLDEQSPKVQEALGDGWSEQGVYVPTAISAGWKGSSLYAGLRRNMGGQRNASLALQSRGIRGIKYLDGPSRNKPLKDVKAEFLSELPEDADFEDVMELVKEGDTFKPEHARVLKALEADSWLGFDYPAQAISAAYGSIASFDPSAELVAAVQATQIDGTYNYVIFDGADVAITGRFAAADPDSDEFRAWHKESEVSEMVYHGTGEDFSEFQGEEGFYFTPSPEHAERFAQGAQPNLMPVYLSVQNLFDTRKPEHRAIYEEKFLGKWGNNTPLNEQNLPDWVESHDFKEFFEEEGFDFDGAVVGEPPSLQLEGDYTPEFSYLVFDPAKVKSATGNRGTYDPENPDIRFAVSDEGKTLQALHGLTEADLKAANKIGGLPMPSIAVTRKNIPFERYGEITMIAPRGMIDPAGGTRTFDADIYSPRVPGLEWDKVPAGITAEIHERLTPGYRLVDDRGYQYYDYLRDNPSRPSFMYELESRSGSKAAFLLERGIKFKPVMRREVLRMKWLEHDSFKKWMEAHPDFDYTNIDLNSDEHLLVSKGILDALDAAIEETYAETPEIIDSVKEVTKKNWATDGLFHWNALHWLADDVRTIRENTQRVDDTATKEKLDEALKVRGREKKFREWREEMGSHFGRPFIRIGKSKVPYTLENAVEAMLRENLKGSEKNLTFSPGQARATGARELKSIEAMHESEHMLATKEKVDATKELLDKQRGDLTDRLTKTYRYYSPNSFGGTWEALDGAMRAIGRYLKKGRVRKSEAAMETALRQEDFINVPGDVIEMAVDYAHDLRDMPTQYFEAKPERGVAIGEFAGAVIPKGADKETRAILKDHKVRVATYDPEVDGDQHRVTQELSDRLDRPRDVRFAAGTPEKKQPASFLEVVEGIERGAMDANPFDPKETKGEAIRRKMQDAFLPVQSLQKDIAKQGVRITESTDPYLQEELRRQKTKERIDHNEQKYVNPIIKTAAGANIGYDELSAFLIGRHATERNKTIAARRGGKPGAWSGMSDGQAAQVMNAVQKGQIVSLDIDKNGILQGVKVTGKGNKRRAAAFVRIGKLFDAMNNRTLDALVRDGLISKEERNHYRKWKHYAPLRTLEEDPRVAAGTGKGLDIRGREHRAALGRVTLSADPLAFASEQMVTSAIRSEKNKVGQSMLKLLQKFPSRMWQVNQVRTRLVYDEKTGLAKVEEYQAGGFRAPKNEQDRTVSVKVDGKEFRIVFDEGYGNVARAFKMMHVDGSDSVTQLMGTATRFLAGMSTRWNPAFLPFNHIRDVLTGTMTTAGEQGAAAGLKVARNVYKAVNAMYWTSNSGHRQRLGRVAGKPSKRWLRYAKEFRDEGGPIAFMDLNTVEDKAKRIRREVAALGKGKLNQKSRELARNSIEWMGDLNDAVENGTRLAAYASMREKGWSKARAASYAKNLTTNFERKGEWGQAMNAWYMFSNAGIQGLARVGEALGHKGVRNLVLSTVAASGLLDIINRSISGDDDDGENHYDKLPEHIKARNIVLMFPDGSGRRVQIPLPFIYGWFWNVGRVGGAMADPRGTTDVGEGALAITESFLDNMNPFGGAVNWTTAFPTVMQPVVQDIANQDWLGRSIRPQWTEGDPTVPDSEKHWPDANPTLKAVTEWLNEVTGGNEVESGAVSISPETMEHYLKFIAGGAGATGGRSANLADKIVSGDPVQPHEIPVMRRLYGEPNPNYLKRRFREFETDLEKATDLRRNAKEKGDVDAFDDATNRYRTVIVKSALIKNTNRYIRRMERKIRAANTTARERALEEAMHKRLAKVNRAINEHRKTARNQAKEIAR